MTERRQIRQRSQAVWDRVRAAYLAGEPARSVARRFDVGYGNLRYRANAEGWTRKAAMAGADAEAQAEALRLEGRADPASPEPEPRQPAGGAVAVDPADAFEAALGRAGAAIAAGRGAEAAGLLKAAETLARLRMATPPGYLPTPEEWAEELKEYQAARAESEAAWRTAETARLEAWWGKKAEVMARALLTDRGYDLANDWAPSALRWRAKTLGPEQALADFARGVAGGWAGHYWDEHGRLKPAGPPPAPPTDMWHKHVQGARGGWREAGDVSGVEWPPKGMAEAGTPRADPAPAAKASAGPRVRRL